jgi:hypothetical protein
MKKKNKAIRHFTMKTRNNGIAGYNDNEPAILNGLKQAERQIDQLYRQKQFESDFGPGHALFMIALRSFEIVRGCKPNEARFTDSMIETIVSGSLSRLQSGTWTLDPTFSFTKEQMLQAMQDPM